MKKNITIINLSELKQSCEGKETLDLPNIQNQYYDWKDVEKLCLDKNNFVVLVRLHLSEMKNHPFVKNRETRDPILANTNYSSLLAQRYNKEGKDAILYISNVLLKGSNANISIISFTIEQASSIPWLLEWLSKNHTHVIIHFSEASDRKHRSMWESCFFIANRSKIILFAPSWEKSIKSVLSKEIHFGIDAGGVIFGEDDINDENDSSSTWPIMEHAIETISSIPLQYRRIVSHAGKKRGQETIQQLCDKLNLFSVDRVHIVSDQTHKASILNMYGLTHLIDDRQDVLECAWQYAPFLKECILFGNETHTTNFRRLCSWKLFSLLFENQVQDWAESKLSTKNRDTS